MKIKTLDFINDRTADGRPFAQAGGVERVIDDSDHALVALMRSLASRGLVEIADDEPSGEPKQKQATEQPAEPKKAVTAPKAPKAGRSA